MGQVEVEITYVYGGFPSRQIEYLASQFGLIHRIRGDNVSNKPMVTRMHSSRMRTARFLPYRGSLSRGLCRGGGFSQSLCTGGSLSGDKVWRGLCGTQKKYLAWKLTWTGTRLLSRIVLMPVPVRAPLSVMTP